MPVERESAERVLGGTTWKNAEKTSGEKNSSTRSVLDLKNNENSTGFFFLTRKPAYPVRS